MSSDQQAETYIWKLERHHHKKHWNRQTTIIIEVESKNDKQRQFSRQRRDGFIANSPHNIINIIKKRVDRHHTLSI